MQKRFITDMLSEKDIDLLRDKPNVHLWMFRQGSILYRIERFWKRLICKHDRTFSFYPDAEQTFWGKGGKQKGPHNGIKIEGCLKCGAMYCRDYME